MTYSHKPAWTYSNKPRSFVLCKKILRKLTKPGVRPAWQPHAL